MGYIEPISKLINQFTKLPGVGYKTAQRYAYAVIAMTNDQAKELTDAVKDVKQNVKYCNSCGNFTLGEENPCAMCKTRDNSVLCVVKEPKDVYALEKIRGYKGGYHVLHGTISPLSGIGPNDIRIKELLKRIDEDKVTEVIMATNTDTEGDATAMYIARLLQPLGVKVTRIAQGLPIGSDIEYADEVTLFKALEDRRIMK